MYRNKGRAIFLLISTFSMFTFLLLSSLRVYGSYGVCGDINGSGRLEITDALYLSEMDVSFVIPQIQTSDLATVVDICSSSDLNRNGDVDISDALVVARDAAGITQPLQLFNCPWAVDFWSGDSTLPQKCANAIWSGPPSCLVEPARGYCYYIDVDFYVLSSTPQLLDIVFEYSLGSTWYEAIPMTGSHNPLFHVSAPQHFVFRWDLFEDVWQKHGYTWIAGPSVRVSLKDPVTGVTINSCDNLYDVTVPPPPRGSTMCFIP